MKEEIELIKLQIEKLKLELEIEKERSKKEIVYIPTYIQQPYQQQQFPQITPSILCGVK